MSLPEIDDVAATCIVCLGDLKNEPHHSTRTDITTLARRDGDHPDTAWVVHEDENREMVARLPCGHHLHDECVKPWVERTNSCPICRQTFNTVELSWSVGAPIVSTYTVQDKVQEAEIDPSMLVEEFSDDEIDDFQPCPVCGDDGDILLICDGCEVGWHMFCVGLDSVPAGDWFCANCAGQRPLEPCDPGSAAESSRAPARSHRHADRRTRGPQRRPRNQNSTGSWARVWQSVWDRLNLDLDFPFEENQSQGTQGTHGSRGRDYRQWERRLQVAERQGGANRFRDTASTLLDQHSSREKQREKPEVPQPESQEEIQAWNAFEKAKEIEVPNQNKRKRRSATASPVEAGPANEHERKLKRPRTRRAPGVVESSSDAAVQPASPRRRRSTAIQSSPRRDSGSPREPNGHGPSFLQSLLKEVESSAPPDDGGNRFRLQTTGPGYATDHPSPHMSSPVVSPTNSNHASPRALSATPPPFQTRPGSPVPLTSKVEPIFPSPEFSPSRSPAAITHQTCQNHAAPSSHPPHHRPTRPGQTASANRSTKSSETSPMRARMPLSAKSDIQKMVSAALKPHYHSGKVSKDQYTDINRNISRMLYDKLGDVTKLDSEMKRGWGDVATSEVLKAVQSLKSAS
ncbi:MAG: hypothetical protein M1835_004055 [Candelina submexicana]|nr:MAG: hypothetical protein M1835_004055 [Candelina submexicana]